MSLQLKYEFPQKALDFPLMTRHKKESFPLFSVPTLLYVAGKHFLITSSMTGTAVEAPGEAPSNAAIEPSAARNNFCTKLKCSLACSRIFNHLYTLTSYYDIPILTFGIRDKLSKFFHSLFFR